MMRAKQQDRLMQALTGLRKNLGLNNKSEETLKMNPSILRIKTERPKSAVTTIPSTPNTSRTSESGLFNPTSFLYTVGSHEWSVESQVRKACSSCFKVFPDMKKKG